MGQQFVIIGLGGFGWRMLERLADVCDDIIVIDRDPDLVEKAKDLARQALSADALNERVIEKLVPPQTDAVIVDLGDSLEASILVTSKLKQMGVRNIVVKTESEDRGAILTLVGATRIVYPDRSAADQVAPVLASPQLFAYMPIGPGLALGEVRPPEDILGKTLVEANLRQTRNVNVVAIRRHGAEELSWVEPTYTLVAEDTLLVAGSDEALFALSGARPPRRRRSISDFLHGIIKSGETPRPEGKEKNGTHER